MVKNKKLKDKRMQEIHEKNVQILKDLKSGKLIQRKSKGITYNGK
mgnify:CR=1 FL=1|jgi:hypothetical protein